MKTRNITEYLRQKRERERIAETLEPQPIAEPEPVKEKDAWWAYWDKDPNDHATEWNAVLLEDMTAKNTALTSLINTFNLEPV